jgi:hypothetical protein
MTPTNLPKGIQEPEGGWKPQTYYWCYAKASAANVPFMGIFYSGFIGRWRDNVFRPAGYATLWTGGSSDSLDIGRLYALQPICEINKPVEQETSNGQDA